MLRKPQLLQIGGDTFSTASLAWYLPVVTGVSTRVGKLNPREVIVISFVKVCETFIILFT